MVTTFKTYYLQEQKRKARKKRNKAVCKKCFQHAWAPWSYGGFGGYAIADAPGQSGIADAAGE
jgi:hypothetical protein